MDEEQETDIRDDASIGENEEDDMISPDQGYRLFEELQKISMLPTLENDMQPVKVAIFHKTKWIKLRLPLYPFSTINDIKNAIFQYIYDTYGPEDALYWVPKFQYLELFHISN